MKICKVVISSALHDPRVLKEGAALVADGHAVTVVGIQDAHNAVPIHRLETGLVVRLAAWQSRAYRPLLVSYTLSLMCYMFAVLSMWVVVTLGWYSTSLREALTWNNATTMLVVLILLRLCWRQLHEYMRRRKTYFNLRKQEKNQLLRYYASLEHYRNEAGILSRKRKRLYAVLSLWSPRPLMQGLLRAGFPANIKRWKVVFAREAAIFALLEEERPEIVHAHDLAALPVAAHYAARYGAKLVFDAHEIYDHLAQAEDEMSEINAKILRKYSGRVDLFITINDHIADYYSRTYRKLPPAVVIKNAAPYTQEIYDDGRLHAAAGLPPETRIALFQGGYAPKRGLMPLLLSAEYLQPGWAIVFMGWGKLESELRRVAEALIIKKPELAERIAFVPRVKQSELPYWTAGASLGVIPYENMGLNHWYCTPNKLWEYPNAGVPMLVSPFPELRAVVEPNALGWLMPDPPNPQGIAAAINALSDIDLSEAAARSREFIAVDNWSVYASRLQEAYRSL